MKTATFFRFEGKNLEDTYPTVSIYEKFTKNLLKTDIAEPFFRNFRKGWQSQVKSPVFA